MDLRELRYFLAVAEHLHFGRAAAQLHIAQPSVSQQVARLERDLGVRLFDRSSRSVRLTAAGQTLLPQARRVLEEAEQVRRLAAEFTAGHRGTLRIGAMESMGWRLQSILLAFSQAQPDLDVSVSTAHTAAKLAALRHGELDVAFVRSSPTVAGLQEQPAPALGDLSRLGLWDEPLRVVLPQRHPLASRAAVPLAALAHMPVSLSPREDNPTAYDLFFALCRRAGFGPVLGPPYVSADDALANVAASADLWLPYHPTHNALVEGGQVPGVAVVPFADLDLSARCSLVWPTATAPAVYAFVTAVRQLRDQGTFQGTPA